MAENNIGDLKAAAEGNFYMAATDTSVLMMARSWCQPAIQIKPEYIQQGKMREDEFR